MALTTFEQGHPLTQDASVWIYPISLAYVLHGKFELNFFQEDPVEELTGDTLGSVNLRTENGTWNLLIISKVPYRNFRKLSEFMGFTLQNQDQRFCSGSLPVEPGWARRFGGSDPF